MSFFDSFGRTLDEQHLRIKTLPCEVTSNNKSINPNVTAEDDRVKPVTEFFINLNNIEQKNEQ
jgi:hypothetical protein